MRREQRDAISKQDYKDNLQDVAELVKLAQALQTSFEHEGSFVIDANDVRAAAHR